MKTNNLEWNVFIYNNNENKIEIWNIFNSVRFRRNMEGIDINSEDFKEEVRGALFNAFAFKFEYEVIITNFGLRIKAEEKIDIYTQVMANIDRFIEYLKDNSED